MGPDLFSYMEDIHFRDFRSCIEKTDTERKNMLDADEELIRKEPFEVDIEHIENIPNGRIYSEYRGYRFECFFYRKNSKYLYVFLNGALMSKRPQLSRWSSYKYMDGSVLCIADPMYEKYKELKLGWYYGDNKHNLRIYVAEYVKKIADYLQVESKDIILFGSSGGGSAALGCGNYITDCIKVAINPQLILSKWGYKSEFESITHCNFHEDNFGRVDGIEHLKNNRTILMLNIRSKPDMEQLEDLCKKMCIDVKYGINVFDNLIIWLFDASLGDSEGAHSLSAPYCILFVIEWVIHNIDNKELLRNNDSFIRLVNEFWYYRFEVEFSIRKKMPDFALMKKCLLMQRKKVVWGAGNIARDFLLNTLEVRTDNYLEIEYIIDSHCNISELYGLKIYSPQTVKDWSEVFIIIAVERGREEIIDYLQNKGLGYEKDFLLYEDFYKN